MASALAKTMTDEERKKAEKARRVKPVGGVGAKRTTRSAPATTTPPTPPPRRGPQTPAEFRKWVQGGGGQTTTTPAKPKPKPPGATNEAEKESTWVKQLKRFFGLTHPVPKR